MGGGIWRRNTLDYHTAKLNAAYNVTFVCNVNKRGTFHSEAWHPLQSNFPRIDLIEHRSTKFIGGSIEDSFAA